MPIYTEKIRAFLAKWETTQTVAYIPCDYVVDGEKIKGKGRNFTGKGSTEHLVPIGVSGVTIATGLDLGQQGIADLKRFGIVGDLQDKLVPYLGRTRYRAMDALQAHPLSVTESECDVIDDGVHDDYIRRASARYNRDSVLPFDKIPGEAQAVIVSLFYHLGSPARYPEEVWDALIAGNWRQAAKALRADDSRYYRRRVDEAALLDKVKA